MTENEIKEATIEDAIYCAKAMACIEVCEECRFYGLCHTWCDDVYRLIVDALEEVQSYRAIGTVEELQKAKEQYDDIHSVAEKTALCGLCDYATAKEAVITEMKRSLDCSLKEYQANAIKHYEQESRNKAIDEAIEASAKAICVGCGYLKEFKCTYKGGNCGVSKPMLESVVKTLEQLKGGTV